MQQSFDNILSKYQFGFHKRDYSQRCLIIVIVKRCESVDKDGSFDTLLIDLLNAFIVFHMIF